MPIKIDDNSENIKPCKKATKISSIFIAKAIGTDPNATKPDCMLIIIPKNAKMIICPAFMFANNLTDNAKGLVNNPINSTGIIIGSSQKGTPGVAKICFQKSLFPKRI